MPFGEYVPLGWLIGFVRSWAEFISDFGVGETETVFRLREDAPFGTVICYEVIFPELFRGFVAGGADFMVNITNDAWFGRTSGPWQHLGMLPLRAVEHRVAIARAANTGISAFVEPSGRVSALAAALRAGRARWAREPADPHRRSTRAGVTGWPTAVSACRPGSRIRTLEEVSRHMLGELKRDIADLEKRLDDLRGHL